MIPRFKPYIGKEELAAALNISTNAVAQFEEEFAELFDSNFAVAFPFGRSALWAYFKALSVTGAEIILPAYTCSVVAHAIVISGNIPRFVDIDLFDYNMNLEQTAAAMGEKTRAIVATHLFGYPMDIAQLNEIVRDAEAKYGHKILVIQDCAHSFGASRNGKLVCNAGDAALYGLNISKTITSIFGGILTTDDTTAAEKLRAFRDANFKPASTLKTVRRLLYLASLYPTFNDQIYAAIHWLEENTPLLDRMTKSYHLDEKIHFPPGFDEQMAPVEAAVGSVQLTKYSKILRKRQELAKYYSERLTNMGDWELPPLVEGATYSHYVLRVPDRPSFVASAASRGVQLGQLIQYCVPYLKSYEKYRNGEDFPLSLKSSRQTLNLPIFTSLSQTQIEKVITCLKSKL